MGNGKQFSANLSDRVVSQVTYYPHSLINQSKYFPFEVERFLVEISMRFSFHFT